MNPLQKAAVRRKAYYFAVIVVLFTLSMFWRGMIPIPLEGKAQAADWMASRTILGQATRLDLRELDQGDPEIAGEAARLSLVGSRGLVITMLWQAAIDKQKRNDFHEFEVLVRTITTLQPNFITPWIFQSWNIAYNVSVEMHSLGDMYFYIARGIELLSEGERRNTHRHLDPKTGEELRIGSPDMRYQIAFYYQNKFGVSDQVETLRCLFQLSCIPPEERNPNLLMRDGVVDLEAFKDFCRKHPHLIRRLRGQERLDENKERNKEKLQCRTPEDVVQFLRDNEKVPSRYERNGALAPANQQFPVLPPKFSEGPDEANPEGQYGDNFSAFGAARAWFSYSLILLPPNPRFPEDEGGEPMPSPTPRPGEYDPFRYRIPRQPMLIIFRQGAPRSQTYQAEMEQKEGWFDDEGWEVDAHIDPANQWFPQYIRTEVGPPTPVGADEVQYVISVWNPAENSAVSLDDVEVRAAVPAGLTLLSADPPYDPQEWEKGRLAWKFTTLGRAQTLDERKTIRLRCRRGPGVTQPPPLSVSPSFRPFTVGREASWSQQEWMDAYRLWAKHGHDNGLILEPSLHARLRETFRGPGTESVGPVGYPPDPTPDQLSDPAFMRRYRAHAALFYYQQNRQVTNFPYYFASAKAEADPRTVQARKTLWKADQARRVADRNKALELYTDGLEQWKRVLLNHPDFHRPDISTRTEEETYEYELEYIRLLARASPPALQAEVNKTARAMQAAIPFLPDPFPDSGRQWPADVIESLKWEAAERVLSPFAQPMPTGGPWVQPGIKDPVRVRQGVQLQSAPPQAPTPTSISPPGR
jgi:hypothetical protein